MAALFLSWLCLFFITHLPLSSNLVSLRQRAMAKRGERRYEPYRAFADELRFDKDVEILVSKDIHQSSGMLGRGVGAHCWMFNIFFNQKFDVDRFIDGTWDDILKGDYTYAFVTFSDWNGLRQEHNVEGLMRDYAVRADERIRVVLLKRRSPP